MVVILRGVPGSGKTTFGQALAFSQDRPAGEGESSKLLGELWDRTAQRPARVVSADDFFVKPDGTYESDGSLLSAAHNACLATFADLLAGDYTGLIVVDNTNTTAVEVAPYAALALAYGHDLQIVTLMCDPEKAHARNVHGVPIGAVLQQALRLQDSGKEIPPWWPNRAVDA